MGRSTLDQGFGIPGASPVQGPCLPGFGLFGLFDLFGLFRLTCQRGRGVICGGVPFALLLKFVTNPADFRIAHIQVGQAGDQIDASDKDTVLAIFATHFRC